MTAAQLVEEWGHDVVLNVLGVAQQEMLFPRGSELDTVLLREGYLESVYKEHRTRFLLTEKGAALLEQLRNEALARLPKGKVKGFYVAVRFCREIDSWEKTFAGSDDEVSDIINWYHSKDPSRRIDVKFGVEVETPTGVETEENIVYTMPEYYPVGREMVQGTCHCGHKRWFVTWEHPKYNGHRYECDECYERWADAMAAAEEEKWRNQQSNRL